MNKKYLLAALLLVFTFVFAGCGSEKDSKYDKVSAVIKMSMPYMQDVGYDTYPSKDSLFGADEDDVKIKKIRYDKNGYERGYLISFENESNNYIITKIKITDANDGISYAYGYAEPNSMGEAYGTFNSYTTKPKKDDWYEVVSVKEVDMEDIYERFGKGM